MTAEQLPEPLPPDLRKVRILDNATRLDQQLADPATPWPKLCQIIVKRQFQSYYWFKPPLWKLAIRYMNKRMMPSFLSLGPARSGTTLLADYILQHPCVLLPLAKEFAVLQYPNLRLIQAQFPTLRDQSKVENRYGMAITGYCAPAVPNLTFLHTLSGITDGLDLKFVLILRNPVDRTFSHWKWEKHVSRRADTNPLAKGAPGFTEMMRLEIDAARSYGTSGAPVYSGANTGGYIQNSIYLPFVTTLFKLWDRSKVLVIDSDDFYASPCAIAKRTYSFLDLPPYEPVDLSVRNAGPAGQMEPEARELLLNFFAPLNRKLFDFLGQDFGWPS
jgi:hypothetical protein